MTFTNNGNTYYSVYNNANQLTETHLGGFTSTLTAAYVYDANGNLTKKCEGTGVSKTTNDCSGSVVTTLTYDVLDQLTQVAKTGLPTEQYVYDDQGRRIQKTVGTATIYYLYNGPDIYAEYAGNWAGASAVYTQGPNMDDPLLRTAADGTTQYYHQDGLGSMVALSNSTGGTDATRRYDAWGQVLASTGTLPQYGYTGREPDATGLVYYRARYYDPAAGRFISGDPLRVSAGENFYAYVLNNPINHNDPTGHCGPLTPLCIAALYGMGSSMVVGGAIRGGVAAYQGKDVASAVVEPRAMAIDAGLGAVMGPFASSASKVWQLRNVPASLTSKLSAGTGSAALNSIDEGVYLIRESGSAYVGQSSQITIRLPNHAVKGFSDDALNNAARLEVIGTKTTREITEQRVLTGLGGRDASGILNQVNPIGGRQYLGMSGSIDDFVSNIAVPGISNSSVAAIGGLTGSGSNALNMIYGK